jgi:hypothetical protein
LEDESAEDRVAGRKRRTQITIECRVGVHVVSKATLERFCICHWHVWGYIYLC